MVPPLVFLHGAGGSASFWRPVADRLLNPGQAHVFGYPGFGGAPADPRIKSLDDLFAIRLAFERGERVARLILVATSGGVDVARLGPEFAIVLRSVARGALPRDQMVATDLVACHKICNKPPPSGWLRDSGA